MSHVCPVPGNEASCSVRCWGSGRGEQQARPSGGGIGRGGRPDRVLGKFPSSPRPSFHKRGVEN